MKPKMMGDVQQCVQWAMEHEIGLTVISGGHSSYCLASNVVAVSMSAFDSVHVTKAKIKRREEEHKDQDFLQNRGLFIVAVAGL